MNPVALSPFLPVKEFLSLVGAGFDDALKPHGFEKISGRRWVRSTKQPIREIVELATINNACFNPRWGFSLDYVPHIAVGGVKWHRTNKSAMVDLTFDPADLEDIRVWAIYNTANRESVKLAGIASARRVVALAIPLFERVREVGDLRPVFEDRLRQRNLRFGFFNYVQHPLAYAFTFAKLRNAAAATEWLQKAFDQRPDDFDVATRQKLTKLLDDTCLKP
jgi:hypothetical protein